VDWLWMFGPADGLAAFCTVTRRPSWCPDRVYLVRCCAGLQLLAGFYISLLHLSFCIQAH
jgi:hypothetical protein